MVIIGTGVVPGTVVTGVNAGVLTLSAPLVATQAGSYWVNSVSPYQSNTVGMTGAGIQATLGVIANSGAGTLRLTRDWGSPTATSTFTTTAAQAAAGTVLPYTGSTSNLYVGMPVSGTNIPAGTTIASIQPGVSVTLSAATTAIVASATAITFPLPRVLTLSGTGSFDLAGNLPGTVPLSIDKANAGTLSLRGVNTQTGNLQVGAAGTINLTNNAALGTGGININTTGVILDNPSAGAVNLTQPQATTAANAITLGGRRAYLATIQHSGENTTVFPWFTASPTDMAFLLLFVAANFIAQTRPLSSLRLAFFCP